MSIPQVPCWSVMTFSPLSSFLTFFAVYILLLVPYSVTRLLQISGWSVPFGAMVFAYTCWFMLGKSLAYHLNLIFIFIQVL
jgi:hypothetical protein